MFRIALFALFALATSSFAPAIGRVNVQGSVPSGVELPAIKGGYPGRTFALNSEEAKRLAREVLPIVADDVARASVQEDILLPVGAYRGLTIDIALNVSVYGDSVCEERHVGVRFAHKSFGADVREMRFTVKDGAIADHAFDGSSWSGRYFALPEKAPSHEAALAHCRSLGINTSGWRPALSLSEFIHERRRISALTKAIETLPMSKIRCLDPQGKACDYERTKLLTLIQSTPPERSEEMIVPEEGKVSVFNHYGYGDTARTDYVVTLRSHLDERPLSLSIRLSTSLPPPQV